MARLLFTHSYFYQFDAKQWATQQPYPPLGTLYAAALMRSNNHEVLLHDSNLMADETALYPVLEKTNPRYLVLYDDGFNYLTKMCLTTMREAAFRMAQYAKQKGCTVIACSSDATDHYQTYLQHGVDYVLHGEGEISLLELVNTLEKKESPKDILGVSFVAEIGIRKNPPRPVLNQLDELPPPAWDLIDIASYRNIWAQSSREFSLNIATTRGCPF
ncbi:MAG: radical SAM protein, partial [Bacteroidota bacterium]